MQKFRTVSQVLEWYASSLLRDYSPTAALERERLWAKFSALHGSDLIDESCPAMLLSFISKQSRCASNWTRKRIRNTICRPFNAAVDYGLINRNPFRGVKIPRGRLGRDWSPSEYQDCLRHASPQFRRFLIFLRFSGARPGEARNLLWSQVAFDADCVVQQAHKTSHLTEAPRRIHFNPVTAQLLAWLKRNRDHQLYVFVNDLGDPWTIGALTKQMIRIRSRAGLPGDLKLHGARHTFATQAIINGVDLRTLADLLGHSTTKTTERYVHLIGKREHLNDAAARAIGRRPPKLDGRSPLD